MRYFMGVMGIIVTLTSLLAIFAGSAQVGRATLSPADDAGSADGGAWICLALVGGTALLAGTVWLGTLRRVPERENRDCGKGRDVTSCAV
jgi:hypothetical protein